MQCSDSTIAYIAIRYNEYKEIMSAFHLCGKTGDNFPADGTVRMEKTVVPLWSQIEQFFPLVSLGNKPHMSTRSMVRECDRGKWSVKTGKEDYV